MMDHLMGQADPSASPAGSTIAAALQDAEALYLSLVEHIPICMYRIDLKGRLTFGNSAYLKDVGHPLEELLGKTVSIFSPGRGPKYDADDRRVIGRAKSSASGSAPGPRRGDLRRGPEISRPRSFGPTRRRPGALLGRDRPKTRRGPGAEDHGRTRAIQQGPRAVRRRGLSRHARPLAPDSDRVPTAGKALPRLPLLRDRRALQLYRLQREADAGTDRGPAGPFPCRGVQQAARANRLQSRGPRRPVQPPASHPRSRRGGSNGTAVDRVRDNMEMCDCSRT